MLVSFIIPAYNAAETLAKAVESLQAQTIGTWEAVIVDDGSADGTLALARQLAASDARLRVLTQPNGGESAARNTGLDAARGDAIAFLDADDWVLPTYVECMTGALAADPDLDGVHCGYHRVTPDGEQGPAIYSWWKSDLFEELSRRNVFAIHACMARRTLVEAVGHFDPRLRTAPDWDFWQRAARTGAQIGAVRQALACYLVRPGSATSNARQILIDGLTVISRGHAPDPRVSRPAERYAAGMPAGRAPTAKLYHACWAAGLAISQGQDGRALLELVPLEGNPKLEPQAVADWLRDAVPYPIGRLVADWPALWPRLAPGMQAFLQALEARLAAPGLAQQAHQAMARWAGVAAGTPAILGGESMSRHGSPGSEQVRLAELEQTRAWLEQQVANWREAVAERDRQIAALKKWIEELEAGKAWLDQQRLSWMRAAHAHEHELRRRLPLRWPRWLRPGAWEPPDDEPIQAEPASANAPAPPEPEQTQTAGKGDRLPASESPQAIPDLPLHEPVDSARPAGVVAPLGASAVGRAEAARGPAAPEPAGPFAPQRLVWPLSRDWGYERGTPIDRHYIELFLTQHAADIRGRVLEVGDNTYTLRFGGERVSHSDVLNVAPGHPQTTFVADLALGQGLPDEAFDCVILTQTLQLIYDTRAALRTVARILKPGGVLLLTCPGLTQTSQTGWAGSWFWRFTPSSLARLLAEAAPVLEPEVQQHGNVLAASAFLYGLAVEELAAVELDTLDLDYDVILTARAVKKAASGPQAIPAAEARPGLPVPGVLQAQPPQDGATIAQADPASGRQRAWSQGAGRPHEALGLVLMYHRVAETELDPWAIAVTPARFEAHMRLVREQFVPVRLAAMRQAVWDLRSPGAPLASVPPERLPVAVTFDDGYADNLHNALPVLERQEVPATFFIATGAVEAQAEFWWDTLERVLLRPGQLPARLLLSAGGKPFEWAFDEWARYDPSDWERHRHWHTWEPPPTGRQGAFLALWSRLRALPPAAVQAAIADLLGWACPPAAVQQRAMGLAELRQLAANELAEVGGHTVRHPSLAALPLEAQRAEIEDGRRWLIEATGRPVRAFAYPFGKPEDYTAETLALVKAAGFEVGVVNIPGVVTAMTDPFQWPRVYVGDWSEAEFAARLSQVVEAQPR
jgi:peptidoglycan/xylan/chitin deacetylase (PgdA/CDA1 family)/SAM-dependent methyltransferase